MVDSKVMQSGRYKAYPAYKDSGVEWLGEIPSGWSVSRIKYLCYVNDGNHGSEYPKESDYTDKDSGVPFIRGGNLKHYKVDYDSMLYITALKNKSMRKGRLKKGDVLFVNRGEIGKLALVSKEDAGANLNSQIAYLRVLDRQISNKYLLYYLDSNYIKNFILSMKMGSVLTQFPIWDLQSIFVPIPVKQEQEKIANFLDYETAKIDTLIEKQKRLIELLTEKRQAVISHAVTKGLNPDVPMKDSGVEWLGEVPEHWEVTQAKYIADITRGAILRPVDAPEYFDENGEWSYLNISDATKCDKYLYDSKLRLSHLGSKKSARVYPNNLIITASATIGKAFINKIKVCVHDGFIPFCNIKVDINYLYHYVSNPYLYAAMGKSNTQKNIYLDEVKNMIVTVPPREEQEKIVEHIEKNQNEYSRLIAKAQQAIQLMQERRTALISAAVTGKIDVRDWVRPE